MALRDRPDRLDPRPKRSARALPWLPSLLWRRLGAAALLLSACGQGEPPRGEPGAGDASADHHDLIELDQAHSPRDAWPDTPADSPRDGQDHAAPDAGEDALADAAGCVSDCALSGQRRCQGDLARSVCREIEPGCLRFEPETSCEQGARCDQGFCQSAGCDGCEDNLVGYRSRCEGGLYRACVERDGCKTWSEPMPCTGQERPVACSPPQPTQEERDAGLKLSLFASSTGPIALGSCVQARQVHDGPCGPCAWYQCVLGPDGQPKLWCDPSLDALALTPEGSPPSTGGYSCRTQWQHIGWTNNHHKLEPNAPARDPWTRWSYYAGFEAAMCPKPLKNAEGKKP